MRNYEVKTPVRGLPRVDNLREPVGVGAVVALPFDRAVELENIGAVEEVDAEVTVELDWPDGSVAERAFRISTVAVTDRHALVDAIVDIGGIVFFVGEGLPDNAVEVLVDFSNDQLLAELDVRRAEGRLPSLSEVVRKEGELEAPYNEAIGGNGGEAGASDPDVSRTAESGTASVVEANANQVEAKPARKKASTK